MNNITDQAKTRFEAAAQLRVSLPTLRKYTVKGIINSVNVGARVLYMQSEIDRVLQGGN